jgi:hypothetical protein
MRCNAFGVALDLAPKIVKLRAEIERERTISSELVT